MDGGLRDELWNGLSVVPLRLRAAVSVESFLRLRTSLLRRLSPLYGVKNESSLRRRRKRKKGREMCPIREVHTRTELGARRERTAPPRSLPANAKPQSFSAARAVGSPQTECIAIAKCFLHSPAIQPASPDVPLIPPFLPPRSVRFRPKGLGSVLGEKKSFCAAVRNAIELFHSVPPLAWRV